MREKKGWGDEFRAGSSSQQMSSEQGAVANKCNGIVMVTTCTLQYRQYFSGGYESVPAEMVISRLRDAFEMHSGRSTT